MSEETERVGSGPRGNSALAGTSCKRVDAFLKNRQEPIAAQLHRLAVDRSQLARVLMDDDDGASNVSIVFLTRLVPIIVILVLHSNRTRWSV